MLDIKKIFGGMPDYVIVRMPENWPDYTPGTDVDVIVKDINAATSYLKQFTDRKIIKNGYHIQMDALKDGKLELKFDLYSRYISDKYLSDTFTLREKDNGFYSVPESLNNVSKCYEYITYNKTKHKGYIKYKDLLDEYTS